MNRSTHVFVLAGALVLAACGSGGDVEPGDAPSPTATDSVDTSQPDLTAPATEPAPSTTAGGEELPPVAEPVVLERGGTLTYLLEAESDTWDIPDANCASSCLTVMQLVADPLLVVNDAGELEPFLLESFDVSADFTRWTFVMRENVTFHDGSPVDGAAIERNLVEMAGGLLQGQLFLDLRNGTDSIQLIDDMTVQVSFDEPFATFGYHLAERTGWVMAPSFWDDSERASALAVSTGPFVMDEWVRGEVTRLVANPDYWRHGSDGAPLPYLDGVELRPVTDPATRLATMVAGDAHATHDSFGENLPFWTGEWVDSGGQLTPPPVDRDTSYLLFNNASGQFADADLRRAMALCTDQEEFRSFREPLHQIATGPFAVGTLGYLDDAGFPTFDPAAGTALLDEIGRPEVIEFGATSIPSNLLTAELFADMWSNNCGLNIEIDVFDESELITRALTGDFELFLWRNHGQGHPGQEFVWWHSRHAEGLATNFGRIDDPELDALLEAARATDDRDELDSIAQDINRRFGEQVYNLWLTTGEWALPHLTGVHGIGTITLDTESAVKQTMSGVVWMQEAWIAT